MNLKERLSSTEKLLRSLRSGDGSSSRPKAAAAAKSEPAQGSIWTRRISLGDVFAGLTKRGKAEQKPAAPAPRPAQAAPQPAAPAARQPEASPRPPLAAPHAAPAAQAPTPAERPFPRAKAAPPQAPGRTPDQGIPKAPPAAPAAPAKTKPAPEKKPFWNRPITFGGGGKDKSPGPAEEKKPFWNRPLSFGKAKAEPSARGETQKPFWNRPVSFGGGGGAAHSIGISICGSCLCVAVLRRASGALVAGRRFPLAPGQAPGEKGFAPFLKACLESLGQSASGADIWAVLRSADLDLNVIAVPKLSGAKLDAAVYWTLQKEKKFAEAEYVLDYIVMGPVAESREPKLEVLTCLARRADVERLRESFRAAGHPLAGITAVPNSLLALYRHPAGPHGFRLAANIHVEQDYSAIGLYTNERLLFSRFIRSGAGSMAETLVEHFQALSRPKNAPALDMELPIRGGLRPGQGAPEQGPEVTPLDSAQAHALLRHVLLGGPRPSTVTEAHLMSPAAMLGIIGPAIERLAKQVERTLDYYAANQQMRCDALHLSGEIFGSPDIVQALGQQLGFSPLAFDATSMVGGGAMVHPAERMSMAPTIAAALSQRDRGVNLLDNYKVRTAKESKTLATRFVVLGLAAILLAIGAAGFLLESGNKSKRAQLQQLQSQHSSHGPMLDEAALSGTVGQFKQRQQALREATQRFLAPAVLLEISRRAPENLKILTLTAEFPQPSGQAGGQPAPQPAPAAQPAAQPGAPGQQTAQPLQGSVTMEAVITGNKLEFDATLSRFILEMQSSPLFTTPMVRESGTKEITGSGQVLYFVMHLGVK